MFNKKTIRDIDVGHKRVLLRVDFNVPLLDRQITDDTRILSALPTIEFLLAQNASVILCSHLGRPEGRVNFDLSLKPVARYLENILDATVLFAEDCVGLITNKLKNEIQPGQVLILENTRFHPGEKANDQEMASELASHTDLFVNDAFGTAHRAHASNVGVANYLPAVAGFLMEKEIKYLGKAIDNPGRPFAVILGGAKVSDKIDVINNLLTKADHILVGGGMANTFFKAQGYPVGDSLVENDALETARIILDKGGHKLRLPVDVVIADSFHPDATSKCMNMSLVPDGWRIMDVGPETVSGYGKVIKEASTIVWNGPMGVFEFPAFAKGTFRLAEELAESDGITIIGGGDSIAAIKQLNIADKFTHISTGGGASLAMLAGEVLPGLAALLDK